MSILYLVGEPVWYLMTIQGLGALSALGGFTSLVWTAFFAQKTHGLAKDIHQAVKDMKDNPYGGTGKK